MSFTTLRQRTTEVHYCTLRYRTTCLLFSTSVWRYCWLWIIRQRWLCCFSTESRSFCPLPGHPCRFNQFARERLWKSQQCLWVRTISAKATAAGHVGKVQHNAKDFPAHPEHHKDVVARLKSCICSRITQDLLKGGGHLPGERRICMSNSGGWSFERDFKRVTNNNSSEGWSNPEKSM